MIKIDKNGRRNKEMLDNLRWLLKASRKKHECRYNLDGILIEEEGDDLIFVATDAKRLHTFTVHKEDAPEFNPGRYEVIKNIASQIVLSQIEPEGTYPNWKKIVSSVKENRLIRLEKPEVGLILNLLGRYNTKAGLLDYKFVADALSRKTEFGLNYPATLSWNRKDFPTTPVLLAWGQTPYRKAFLMPIRYCEDEVEISEELNETIDESEDS